MKQIWDDFQQSLKWDRLDWMRLGMVLGCLIVPVIAGWLWESGFGLFALMVFGAFAWWFLWCLTGTCISKYPHGDANISDYRKLRTNELIGRRIVIPGKYSAYGPMDRDGNFHGEWSVINAEFPERSGPTWYWHGEQVAETEFREHTPQFNPQPYETWLGRNSPALKLLSVGLMLIGVLSLYGRAGHWGFAYLLVAALIALASREAYIRFRPHASRWTPFIIAAAAIASFFLAWRLETHEVEYRRTDGGTERTTYRSWDQKPVYVRIQTDNLWADGPVTASGKFHGEWSYLITRPKFETRTVWYWYGEEVTEGEYAARAK